MQCQKLKTYMETGRVVFLPIRFIGPNPAQPRQIFDEEALARLAESISRHGILQPLTVRRSGSGYVLVAGERRLRAASMAGLTEVPCVLMQMDDRESALAAMVENLQRKDLDYIEEAIGIRNLMKTWNMHQEEAALALGKSQSAVANKLRLLRHSPKVLAALREHNLSERHGRALLRLTDEEEILRAIAEISRKSMSVSQAESYISSLLVKTVPKERSVSSFLNGLTQSLQKIQQSGVAAVSERRETETQIVFTITIPKSLPENR